MNRSTSPSGPPALLTQGVGDAGLHTGRADMADAVLMLWLDQNCHLDVPQGLHGNLWRECGVITAPSQGPHLHSPWPIIYTVLSVTG